MRYQPRLCLVRAWLVHQVPGTDCPGSRSHGGERPLPFCGPVPQGGILYSRALAEKGSAAMGQPAPVQHGGVQDR